MAVYEIAGVRFKLTVTDPFTQQYIDAYRVDGEDAPETMVITQEDIAFERTIQPNASIGLLTCCAVCRNLSRMLLYRYDGMLVHSAAMLYEGKAYLFVAPSGTGKTTHVMLWKKCMGDKMAILNGDKPFLRRNGDEITVYGSPWQGKEDYGMNASAPLGGVIFVNRDVENSVRHATVPEALQRLALATVLPEDAEGRSKVLDFVDHICKTVPVGMLYCNMEDEAVYTAKSFIDENKKQS